MDYKIPTKIVFHGDYDRCQAVMGVAKSRLNLLEERLRRSKGMVKQGWQKPITLMGGEIITLGVSFNTSVIHIYAGGEYGRKKKKLQECFCDCNLSRGVVTVVHGEEEDIEPDVRLYDVLACNNERSYVEYHNILASDFTRYVVGQAVLVMAFNEFEYLCCTQVSRVAGCAPKISEYSVDWDEWRTTYRIVPFCAEDINLWIREWEEDA